MNGLEDILNPSNLKNEVERLYDGIMNGMGVKLIEVSFNGLAGGEAWIKNGRPSVTIITIPQAEAAWEDVVSMFEDPWIRFKPIKQYIKNNNLIESIVNDDDVVKQEIYAKFRPQLINWAYNRVWEVYSKYYAEKVMPEKTVTKINKPTKPTTPTKPLHRNKAVVGGIGITIASAIVGFLNAHISPAIAMGIAGILSTILAAIEHKSVGEIEREILE